VYCFCTRNVPADDCSSEAVETYRYLDSESDGSWFLTGMFYFDNQTIAVIRVASSRPMEFPGFRAMNTEHSATVRHYFVHSTGNDHADGLASELTIPCPLAGKHLIQQLPHQNTRTPLSTRHSLDQSSLSMLPSSFASSCSLLARTPAGERH